MWPGINSSLLAPWQKINALNSFLMSHISFILRQSAMEKVHLNKADSTIRHLVKKWMFLPQRATIELVYISHSKAVPKSLKWVICATLL